MRDKKALIISDLQNASSTGGVEKYLYQLSDIFEFYNIPFDIHIETDQEKSIDKSYSKLGSVKIKKIRPKIFRNNVFGVLYDLTVAWKHGFSKYDMVIVNASSVSSFWGVSPRKSIHILHSIFQDKIKYRHFLFRFFSANKKVVTVSKHASDAFNKNAASCSSSYVYNGVKIDSLPGKSNQDINVISVGQCVSYKGVLDWIDVAKKVVSVRRDVRFIWLGDGPLYNSLKKEANDNIVVAGHTDDVHKFLATGDIYYHPSHKENHSLSIIEAMGHSLPVVACRVGGNNESVCDGVNGYLLEPSDTNAHAEAILEIVDNGFLRDCFSGNSYNRYIEKFKYETWEQEMVKLFKSVCPEIFTSPDG